MKYISLITGIYIISLLSCEVKKTQYETSNNMLNESVKKDNWKTKTITIPVNNNDSKFVGFKKFIGDESVGVKSLIIRNDIIYLLDTYHNNIKTINVNSEYVKASEPFSKDFRKTWLRDIGISNDKIFVIGDLTMNFIVNLNLSIEDSFNLPKGKKYFYKISNEQTSIITLNGLLKINSSGGIVEKMGKPNFSIYSNTRGKKYNIEDSTNFSSILTPYDTIKLKIKFPYTWDYYDAINLDYSDKYIVFYQTNPEFLKLFIHKIGLE